MNWIERLYELKGKDQYSQSGEGHILEYIFDQIPTAHNQTFVDIGGGDGFYLSNTRHLGNLGWSGKVLDKENGVYVTAENVNELIEGDVDLVSIDIDGNDFWVLNAILSDQSPAVIIAEFNAAYIESKAIKYDPDHEWDGDSYYGFTFGAGKKLAELFGYQVIFQVADMNMIMVRKDLIHVDIPPVTFKQNNFFELSKRLDWVKI